MILSESVNGWGFPLHEESSPQEALASKIASELKSSLGPNEFEVYPVDVNKWDGTTSQTILLRDYDLDDVSMAPSHVASHWKKEVVPAIKKILQKHDAELKKLGMTSSFGYDEKGWYHVDLRWKQDVTKPDVDPVHAKEAKIFLKTVSPVAKKMGMKPLGVYWYPYMVNGPRYRLLLVLQGYSDKYNDETMRPIWDARNAAQEKIQHSFLDVSNGVPADERWQKLI